MDVVCEKCQNVIKIPDEKVPKGKSFSIGCPRCKHKNAVNPDVQAKTEPSKQNPAPPPPKAEVQASDNGKPDTENGAPGEGGFGYLEEGAKTALLCESNSDFHTKIRTALENIGYKVLAPAEPREALKQLRFHDFDVVVLNEMFGTRNPDVNHVHKHLSQLQMHARRNIFVALISERFKTGDNMQTFNRSVNQIIHTGDVDRVEKILKRSIHDNDTFYRVVKESIAKIKG